MTSLRAVVWLPWVLASLCLGAGGLFVRGQQAEARRVQGWVDRLEADLAAVQALDETVQSLDGLLDRLPPTDSAAATPLAALATLHPTVPPRLVEVPPEGAGTGWRPLRFRIEWGPLDVADALEALAALEEASPPWRVERLVVRPGPRVNQVALAAEVLGARAP